MRARFLLGVLFPAALALAAPAAGQSYAEFSGGLAPGLFDGVTLGVGANVATGIGSFRPDYGIYSTGGGRRVGDYRYGGGSSGAYRDRGYSDYCWRQAWGLR